MKIYVTEFKHKNKKEYYIRFVREFLGTTYGFTVSTGARLPSKKISSHAALKIMYKSPMSVIQIYLEDLIPIRDFSYNCGDKLIG